MSDLISKQFVCNDCGPISFFVILTKDKAKDHKHVCFWCGGTNVAGTGLEEVIEGNEIVTYFNNSEIKRRRKRDRIA